MKTFQVTGKHHQFGNWSDTFKSETEALSYAKAMAYASFGIEVKPLYDTQYKVGDVVVTKSGREVLIMLVYPASLFGKFLDDGHHTSWHLSGKYIEGKEHDFDLLNWVRNQTHF